MPISSPASVITAISRSPGFTPGRPIGRHSGQWCGTAVCFESVVFWIAKTEVDCGERIRKCVVEVAEDSAVVTEDDCHGHSPGKEPE